jgi:sodium-dependent phosphate cotransporter
MSPDPSSPERAARARPDGPGPARPSPGAEDDPPGEAALGVLDLRAAAAPEAPARGWRRLASKVLHFVPAMYLFILAIQLMKAGAQALRPYLVGTFPFDNAISSLGLGWVGAYFVLSGSPVAAVALVLFSAGAITPLQTFTMLSGSRLGASFIVLLVGFLYMMRDRGRRESLAMGVLALSLTAVVYVPGMLLGYGILRSGLLSGVRWAAGVGVQGLIDLGWGPVVDLASVLPGGVLFPLGLAAILLSFRLLDRVLPEIDHRHAEGRHHWLRKPWPMFFLGCLAALLTLSVSVAITVLVPLAGKGYVDRKEAVPYIMGANITTLADTLVAAMLLGRPLGVQIVLAEAVAVALVTVAYLLFAYGPLQRAIIAIDDWAVGSTRRLVLFVAGLFLLPAVLLVSGRIIGPLAR